MSSISRYVRIHFEISLKNLQQSVRIEVIVIYDEDLWINFINLLDLLILKVLTATSQTYMT